ncbi:MAG: 1-(5-phosphoribosyl)-5-((5-phosphoribosylamino)methylideneamino)imidazole-4-carboxamide isomerase [Rhodanobacteraceae bacterium]|nr:1-(5-phosphoribosyl)-5-((5-phosphoribosylamino)methylideneamino)imidazole-4-carboxamide isomerase [Rhodanobacteraceae bacterium]MBP9153663.1 1-(5-phosphoribosyl)-5-((5-phosphoribosylamino)methylideneamino)imidazole-4-carboxamide isomerase [Xanthomonadales bacterium]
MIPIPAIDLREGRVVRLRQGDYNQQRNYDIDAVQLARRYAAEGARRLHVVDLDAARDGGSRNRLAICEIATGLNVPVQAGGGVRDESDLYALFRGGVAAAVVGSVSVRDPQRVIEWARVFGRDRIVVALDTRELDGAWTLPLHGWTEASGVTLQDRIALYLDAGLDQFLITDIARDGMMSGPSLDLYRSLRASYPQARIQASGGIDSVAALTSLRTIGASGAIIGRALLEARFTVAEANAC